MDIHKINVTPPVTPATPKRILIVEDDTALANLYRTTLEKGGYQVTAAYDGESGFNQMQAGGYNLVLLDLLLPKKGGLEILKDLQTHPPQNPNGTIIILSNLQENINIAEGAALGVTGYMIKSDYTPGQILEKVRYYLGETNTENTQTDTSSSY